MNEEMTVTIKLNDLTGLRQSLKAEKAVHRINQHALVAVENTLIEKNEVIERLSHTISATEDAADNEIGYLKRKNRKLKKKLKKAQRYGDELSGAAIFGESFEGIKCTFDPESAVDVMPRDVMPSDPPEFIFICGDDGDYTFWLGSNG